MGSALTLVPREAAAACWRFVARTRFRVGRSHEAADFVARFLPESAANAERTKVISRVHVLAEVRNGGLALRDGNGSMGSVNGSEFDGVPLSSDCGTPLDHPGVLCLRPDFLLKVVPIFTPDHWKIANPVGWLDFDVLAPPAIGAVAFESIGEPGARVGAIWLLNRAGFQFGKAGDLEFEAGRSAEASGMFFFQSSCFLLANLGLPEEQIQIDGAPVSVGEAVPLRSTQGVRLGGRLFDVQVA